MKKFINKKNMKKFIIISAIIGIGFLGINYTFCYPTKINAYVAANVYSEPANSYFEDDNFYQCVVDAYNSTNNTSLPYTINLSNSQLQTITKLYCINDGIVSAKGLETMINLTTLSLVQNKLTELDVSDNVLLTTLAISNNQLIELNLKGALSLTELDIKYNQLENIDISNNVELKRLSAQGNQLTNLNTSNNLKLEDLDLSINKIQSLDLRNNDLLIDLNLWQNQITEIDLRKNVLLDDLSVSDNQLTKLDVSNNQALRTLNVSNNQLTSLDLSNNAKLESLSAAYNKLSNLDINNNIALKSLGLSENDLKQIILDKNINLNILTLNDNELTELDVSKNTNLTSLKIDGNELSSLDVSKNTNLTAIHVGANQLKSLNLDNNISLVNLSIYNNQLTSLDVSKNTALKYLYAQNNELTSLVVSGTTSLSSLNVANNKLKDLNISNNISLTELRAYNNSLDELDVSENAGLKILDISNNKLNDIDVSNNVLLEALLIDGNNLSYLDISNNNNLSAGSGCKHDTAKALCINDVSKEKAIYKGDTYQYEELIKYPISWNIDYYTSTYSDSERKNIVQSSEATKDENSITPITLDYIYIARGNNILNGYGITTTYINLYVIEATSDKYEINIEEGYINTLIDSEADIILNNINLNYGKAYIEDNKLLIKYNNELIKSFDIVGFSSDDYDLSNEYILSGGNTDLEKINVVNGNVVLEDNLIKIKHGDKVIKTFYESSFVDQNFYNCVIDSYNLSYTDKLSYKNHISEEQLLKVKNLHCSNYGKNDSEKISSTKGLEKLTNITFLSLTHNLLTNIDLSNNIELTDLYLTGNQLSELDLSKNVKLLKLFVGGRGYSSPTGVVDTKDGNNITTINLENNILLKTLSLRNNPLNELNISKNTLLEWLSIQETNISNLDVSKNINLNSLNISYNNFTDIDLSTNHLLEALVVNDNKLTSLDVSNNVNLKYLWIYNNELTSLDVSNNASLEWLYGYNNQLTELNVSKNTKLSLLHIFDNELNKLDLSNNIVLDNLAIYNNKYKENIFVYKGNNIIVGENVKIPSQLGWNSPTWTTKDSSIATVSSDGSVSTLKSGTVNISGTVSGKYNTTSTINVVEITSDKYTIDEENNIIFIRNDSIDAIKDNINVSHSDVVINIDKDNNKLNVTYGNNILKEYKIVSFSSNIYDLSKNYIYTGLNSLDKNNINVINGIGNIIDNKFQIKCGEIILEEFDIVSVSTNTIKLISDGNLYVDNKTEDEIREGFNVINAETNIYEDRIEIIRDNIVLDTFKLFSINFGDLKIFDKNVTVSKNTSYDEFINKITITDGLSYKVFDGEEEFTTGIIDKDLILKVYYNDEEIDSYNVTNEYLTIDESISVDSDNNYFNGIGLNSSVKNILNKIDTTGEVTIMNKDNKVITGNDLIGTGSVVSIKLSKETYNYTVIIHGDVDGDGALKLSDIMKIANYTYKNKNSLSGVFEIAADFDNNGTHNLQDIMKSAKALYGGK